MHCAAASWLDLLASSLSEWRAVGPPQPKVAPAAGQHTLRQRPFDNCTTGTLAGRFGLPETSGSTIIKAAGIRV